MKAWGKLDCGGRFLFFGFFCLFGLPALAEFFLFALRAALRARCAANDVDHDAAVVLAAIGTCTM